MEFDQIPLRYPAIQLQTWFPTCRRQVRAISTCRDSWNLVADRFAAEAGKLVRELLSSWIAPDWPNSITLSTSLAGGRPTRQPARELYSVMEFFLYSTSIVQFVPCNDMFLLVEIKGLHRTFSLTEGDKLCFMS